MFLIIKKTPRSLPVLYNTCNIFFSDSHHYLSVMVVFTYRRVFTFSLVSLYNSFSVADVLYFLISAMDFPVGKRRQIIKRRHSVKKNISIFFSFLLAFNFIPKSSSGIKANIIFWKRQIHKIRYIFPSLFPVSEYLYLVSNAGCRDKDLQHLRGQLKKFVSEGGRVELEVLDGDSLVALQGPLAASVLQVVSWILILKFFRANILMTLKYLLWRILKLIPIKMFQELSIFSI